MISIASYSSSITKKIGRQVAQEIIRNQGLDSGPVYILLEGNLGAGKTTFTIGFLSYFGIKPSAVSPTFTIMKHYQVNKKHNTQLKDKNNFIENVYHLDAYRLQNKKDLEFIGFSEIQKQPHTVVLMEWPGNVQGLQLHNGIRVRMEYGKKEKERMIILSAI